jgi:hypothetical protein
MRQNRMPNKPLQSKQIMPLTAHQEVSSSKLIVLYYTIFVLRFTIFVTPSFHSNNQYGWAKQTLTKPVAGREGSDLTKFAAELVKNGVY